MSAYFTYQPNSKAETPEDVCINAEVRLGFRREPKILFILVRISSCANQNTHRGARTHDRKVKSLALYRLSQAG